MSDPLHYLVRPARMQFRSDNNATIHPAMLAALADANTGAARAYGEDEWTKRLNAAFAELFGDDMSVHLVATGTAANSIALAALTPPWGAIYCHREAHIETDECGAPTFFSGGAKLVLIDGLHAKITPEGLREAMARNQRGIHSVAPAAVSISQASERGACYTADEIAALAEIAHGAGLALHMDGARLANAAVHLKAEFRDFTRACGVDALSFGATKNGAMAAEAIVVFGRGREEVVARVRKRSGHLLSKHRYIAVQMLAYLGDDLWRANAARANGLAARIGAAAGDWVSAPVETNQIFIKPGAAKLAALRASGADFYDWGPAGSGEARLVVSWDQDETEVDALCAVIARLRA